ATSAVLAKALERESADLILFGQQANDSDGAFLWAAVADRLRLPVVSQAAEVTLGDGKATVKRQTEFGYDVIESPLPVVIAVSDAINEPRYPSLKGIMGAKSKPQETLSLAELELEAPASQTGVYALRPTRRATTGQQRSTSPKARSSRRRCRSPAWTSLPSSCATRASTPCCSRTRCSPRTSPRGSRHASTRA